MFKPEGYFSKKAQQSDKRNEAPRTGREQESEQQQPLPGILQLQQKLGNQAVMQMVRLQSRAPIPTMQKKSTSSTGMPDSLKDGIEALSGMALDDVRVHYNSSKPAEVQAHAYAQGTDIHVAPGQEKHLPHEAWHIVQQKQGRVQPTVQLSNGAAVNDNPSLEREADQMGQKAIQFKAANQDLQHSAQSINSQGRTGRRSRSSLKKGSALQRVAKEALGYEAEGTEQPEIVKQIETLIGILKAEEKVKKEALESDKNKYMETAASKKDRQDYLWNHYVPALRKVGLDHEKLMSDARFIEIQNNHKFTLFKTGSVTELQKDNKTFYKLYRGIHAYRKKKEITGLERDVWEKIGSEKEYVKDDEQQFTRRLAYVEKNKYQLWDFMNTGVMTGRHTGDPFEKSDSVRNRIKYATEPDKPMNIWEMLYTHQELGSGPEQRGVSIASTPRLIHSNQGEAFESDDGATFTLDLAQIPRGEGNLVSHYSPEALEKQSEFLKDVGMYANRRGTGELFDERSGKHPVQHYLNSVVKNRELYARTVPKKAVNAIRKRFDEKGAMTITLNRTGGKHEIDWHGTPMEIEQQRFKEGKDEAKRTKSKTAKTVREDTPSNAWYDQGFNEGVDYNKKFQQGYDKAKSTKGRTTIEADGPSEGEQGYAAGYNYWVEYILGRENGYQDAYDKNAKAYMPISGLTASEKGFAEGYNECVGHNIEYDNGFQAGYEKAQRFKWRKPVTARDRSYYQEGFEAGVKRYISDSASTRTTKKIK